jgi:hypothetical protein
MIVNFIEVNLSASAETTMAAGYTVFIFLLKPCSLCSSVGAMGGGSSYVAGEQLLISTSSVYNAVTKVNSRMCGCGNRGRSRRNIRTRRNGKEERRITFKESGSQGALASCRNPTFCGAIYVLLKVCIL